MTITEAQCLLDLLVSLKDDIRITMPYSREAWRIIQAAGYLPIVENTAWNDKEIAVSTRVDYLHGENSSADPDFDNGHPGCGGFNTAPVTTSDAISDSAT